MVKAKSRLSLFFFLLILLTVGNYTAANSAELESNSPEALIYSTYLGGNGGDRGLAMAVDVDGNVYVAGGTSSHDFPTTTGAYDTSYGGYGFSDIFVTKLDPTGSYLVYSTYLGGIKGDGCNAIAVDTDGNVYIVGLTSSFDFPITFGVYDSDDSGAFIAKLDPTGSYLVFSTYLSYLTGNKSLWGEAIALDADGNIYIAGYTRTDNGKPDVFVIKLDPTGTEFLYSFVLGGSEEDYGLGIAVDAIGNIYVAGLTRSSDFPTTPDAYDTNHNGGPDDAFVIKLDPTGTELLYSTYLGGSGWDMSYGITVDEIGNAYITGYAQSDFPTTPGAYDTTISEGDGCDAFVTKLDPTGTELLYSTYLGGSLGGDFGHAIAIDTDGNAYVTGGMLFADDFPTTLGAYDSSYNGKETYDAFVTKFNPTGTRLVYSTYLGGSDSERGEFAIAIDADGNAYVTGYTKSIDFPVTYDAYDTSYNENGDAFVTKIPILVGLITSTAGTAGGGTIDPEPGTYIFNEGAEVTITATPNSGYKFSNWSGDASGTDNPITITMDSDKSVTANFVKEETPAEKKGGCFIATAAYGSQLHPHLNILRDFRDRYLMPTKLGSVLVCFYYKYSPFLADLIKKHKVLKIAVQINLMPLVVFGYSMVHFGPIFTIVMLALIFTFPILFISFYRKKLSQLEAKDPKALASR